MSVCSNVNHLKTRSYRSYMINQHVNELGQIVGLTSYVTGFLSKLYQRMSDSPYYGLRKFRRTSIDLQFKDLDRGSGFDAKNEVNDISFGY